MFGLRIMKPLVVQVSRIPSLTLSSWPTLLRWMFSAVHAQFISGGGDDKGFMWAVKDDGTVGGSCELGG